MMAQRYTNRDRTVAVSPGAHFEVELPSVPTAGYEWHVTVENDCVELVKRVVVPTGTAIGGGAVERFTFLARGAKACNLRFEYRRPWERGPHETIRMAVQIR